MKSADLTFWQTKTKRKAVVNANYIDRIRRCSTHARGQVHAFRSQGGASEGWRARGKNAPRPRRRRRARRFFQLFVHAF